MADAPDAEQVETDSSEALDVEGAGVDSPDVSPPSFVDALRQRGLEISDEATDDDVISRMEELESAYEERERLKHENAQLQAWRASQQQQAPDPAPPAEEPEAEKKPSAPPRPEWNRDWEQYLTTDDRGRVVIRKEDVGAVDPQLPQKYVAWMKWKEEQLEKVLSRSDDLFDESRFETIKKEAEEAAYKRAIEEFEKRQKQSQVQTYLEKYEEQHSGWLKSESGGFTPVGDVFNEALASALERGLAPQESVEYAEYVTQKRTGKSPWAEGSESDEPAPTPQQKKTRLRRTTNNGVNRIAQQPVRRSKPTEEIEPPNGRQLADSWASQMRQKAGIED